MSTNCQWWCWQQLLTASSIVSDLGEKQRFQTLNPNQRRWIKHIAEPLISEPRFPIFSPIQYNRSCWAWKSIWFGRGGAAEVSIAKSRDSTKGTRVSKPPIASVLCFMLRRSGSPARGTRDNEISSSFSGVSCDHLCLKTIIECTALCAAGNGSEAMFCIRPRWPWKVTARGKTIT
jgi:hypothetical protein